MLELYNKRGDKFSSTLALGALLIYQMLHMMDPTAIQEYAKWLAFHLANTRLSWPYWDHWVNELQDDSTKDAKEKAENDDDLKDMENSDGNTMSIIGFDSINGMFCRMVVDRLARIFVPPVVQESLPPALQPWVSNVKDALAVHVNLSTPIFIGDVDGTIIETVITTTRAELSRVGDQLKAMVNDREDADKVEVFLDEGNITLDNSIMADYWRGSLLLKVILLISGQVLSVLSSFAEKYSNPLRLYGESSASQEAMIRALAYAFHLNGGVFSIILDILIRRGIIQPAAVALWLTSRHNPISSPISGLRGLGSDIYVYGIVTNICQRAIDFVKASVSARLQYGDDMVFDETLDISAASNVSVVSTIPTTIASSTHVSASSSNIVDEDRSDDDDDIDDDGDGRRNRHITEDVQVMEEEDEDVDPKSQASEIVISALTNSRSTYKTLISSLLDDLIPIERNQDSSADRLKPWSMTALSLLRYILRSFHEAEDELNLNRINIIGKSKVILTDASAVRNIFRKHALTEEETNTLASVISARSYIE